MAIRFQCPDCKATQAVDSDKAGARVDCSTCKGPLIVPSPGRQPKLGIFIEVVPEAAGESNRQAAKPVEKDWRTEPPLPMAEELPLDDEAEEPDTDEGEEEEGAVRRPPRRFRSMPPHNSSLVVTSLLILLESLFGVAALAMAVFAFLRTQNL